ASVNVKAESEDFMVSATFALGAGKVAVGAEVNVFVFDRDVLAQVGRGSKVSAELGDVVVRANAMDYAVVVSIGASGGSNTAVSGTIPVIVSLNRVLALIGTYVDDPADTSEAKTLLDATGTSLVSTHGSVGVISDYKSDLYAAAGAISGSGSAAVGATILTIVVENDVHALVGTGAYLAAGGGGTGIEVPGQSSKRKDVSIAAHSSETYLAAAISGAAAGNVAVAGVVNTVIFGNRVRAVAYGGSKIDANTDDAEGDLLISASSDSKAYVIGGSLGGAGSVAVGATVLTFVYEKDVLAEADAAITARNIDVHASSTDDVYVVGVSASASGSVAVSAGSAVLFFQDTVTSRLAGGPIHASGNVDVSSYNNSKLVDAVGNLAVSGTAAITGAVAVTYFEAHVESSIAEGTTVTAEGAISVTADSVENVNIDAIGFTGSGTAAVSGTIGVVVTKVVVRAFVGNGATLTCTNLTVLAKDDYTMLGIVATGAISGVAGVGASVLVSVSNNTVEAYVGDNATVTASGDVNVNALANRDVRAYLGTAAGGQVGVGVTVLVSVVGGKLSQDSADALRGQKESEDSTDSYT
ncbi:MAG: hypothetical protein ACRC75_12720, partial [Olsenella sp.]